MTVFRLSGSSELPVDIRLSNVKAVEATRPQIAGAEANLVIKAETVTQPSYYNTPSAEVLERGTNSPIPLHEPEAYGGEKNKLRLFYSNGEKLDIQFENIVGISPVIRYGSDAEIMAEVENPTWDDNQHFVAAAAEPVNRDSDSNVPLQ